MPALELAYSKVGARAGRSWDLGERWLWTAASMSDDDEAVQAANDVHAMVFALDAAAVRAAAAAGVNVNAFDAEGLTPAHYAASADKADMVRVLAEVGVDVNSPASTTVRLCPRRFRCAPSTR